MIHSRSFRLLEKLDDGFDEFTLRLNPGRKRFEQLIAEGYAMSDPWLDIDSARFESFDCSFEVGPFRVAAT